MKELEAIKARVEGHTKGPWEVAADLPTWESEEGGFDVGPEDAPAVAIVEGLADAELIAAAPKLLAALEAVDGICEYLLAEFPTMQDATLAKGWNHARKVMRELITEALA